MAVVIETTIGDFTVDLFVDSRPQACKNFLKLCKMKYYNFCLFHSVQPNFLGQTGDPSGTGSGGESIYGLLYGENARFFEAETMPKLKHNKPGLLSMVNCGNNMLGSQFFITLGEDLVSLDGEHCVFGEISEGAEIVLKLNEAICDTLHRPYKDIRITHTIILEDPFDDPSGLIVPDMSPEATQERLANGRIGADEEVDETQGLTAEQVEELRQEREAKARATILEIVGDLPDAEMAPPENVLFVCKLNPVTTDDDLEIIFSRFGKVKSCEVIRDKNTGDSLQYAFVEFDEQKACEEAYFKMDNVLIDDRRIHVDFSQSVAKMRWKGKGRGVEYFDNKDQGKEIRSSGNREREDSRPRGERSSRRERDREYEERERRKDRGRDREEDRGREREKERSKDSDDRHRRRDDRDRSRSDWRKRDKRDHRDDEKRYDKRREAESSRKREDDSKRVSSSSSSNRRGDERKHEVKRSEEKKIEVKESRSLNGKSSRQLEFTKSESVEKPTLKNEKQEIGEKERGRGSKYNSPLHIVSKDEAAMSDSVNDSQEMPTPGNDSEKSLSLPINKDTPEIESKTNNVPRRSSKDDKSLCESIKQEDFETDRVSEGRSSQKSDKKVIESKSSPEKEKKKSLKRKRKMSESRKRKKRRHSSSSESSSESSDSSDSSSSSDSSDYKHSKKKKLIVAKRYYRGGKLVKEIKKKKRTKDTSDSESVSEESSDSDSKRKYKSKKHKKVTNVYKPGKKKSVQSSEDSQSESSSSEDSDERSKKRKKKASDKHSKKKSKHSSSKKKKRRKGDSSTSSDSEDSVQSKSLSKKQKKVKNSKHSTNLVTTTSE